MAVASPVAPEGLPDASITTVLPPNFSAEAAGAKFEAFSVLARPDADWELPSRYRFRKIIGAGSYGSVCEATDNHNGGESVAIKRIPNLFDDIRDGRRILRELSILGCLERRGGRRPNSRIVRLLDVLVPSDLATFEDLYLVMEHCGQDLRVLARRRSTLLAEPDVQGMLRDLLLGLQELHAAGIFHRDLKPANCLVRPVTQAAEGEPKWQLKICDFGHARTVGRDRRVSSMNIVRVASTASACSLKSIDEPPQPPKMKRALTCHVATRWYRAPELILLQGDYTGAVDVWSSGCVLAEMFRLLPGNAPSLKERGPLFPGIGCFPLSPQASEVDDPAGEQIALILNLVGSPTEAEVDEIMGGASYDANAMQRAKRDYLQSFAGRSPKDLSELFPASSADSLHLLGSMLQFSPKRRVKVDDALEHAFLTRLRESDGSPHDWFFGGPDPVGPLEFESEDFGELRLRQLLLQEIQLFHPEMPLSLDLAALSDAEGVESTVAGPPSAATVAGCAHLRSLGSSSSTRYQSEDDSTSAGATSAMFG